MKKFLLSLLVFVMLTPGLACAGFMDYQKSNGQKPHMTMAGMAKEMPCCPEDDQKSDIGTMLFKDCAKIDLQHVNGAPLLKKVDIVKISIPYILSQDMAPDYFSVSKGVPIHGPPERTEVFQSYPPIFLATQRLRI
ncbi:MAG: hypothetical protein V1721_01955 [Pseudomonadota bacterium]